MSMVSVIYAECHNLPHYAEYRYDECRYAECRGARKIVDQSNKTFYKIIKGFIIKELFTQLDQGLML
jgi:hypothetical protein